MEFVIMAIIIITLSPIVVLMLGVWSWTEAYKQQVGINLDYNEERA